MEICDHCTFIVNYCWKEGAFCSSCRVSKLDEDMRRLRRQVTHAGRTLVNSNQWLRRSQCIYPISPWTGGMRALCDTRCSPSIISVPYFPQRPLNLTAMWWFAAITVHSWVKINLWDLSLGRYTWLCAGYDNLPWFIYLRMVASYNLHREYGQGIQYHPAEIQGRGQK